MKLIQMIPQICEWTALMLTVFIAVKSSLLFNYYQKIGILSLYYLYASLFGLSMSILQGIYIFTEIFSLPGPLLFFKFVVSLLICITFIGFMYLLWKRPHHIGILRVCVFMALYTFALLAVPILEGENIYTGMTLSSFGVWYFPVTALSIALLLFVTFYYWRIAHFKNGLSVVVIFSLLPFSLSTLSAALSPNGSYPTISYILYVFAFLPLCIKLTAEGFDSGYKHDNDFDWRDSGK